MVAVPTTRMSSRGQVVIPEAIRIGCGFGDDLGLVAAYVPLAEQYASAQVALLHRIEIRYGYVAESRQYEVLDGLVPKGPRSRHQDPCGMDPSHVDPPRAFHTVEACFPGQHQHRIENRVETL